MTQVQKQAYGWTTVMRWVARLVGLAAVGLFAAFVAAAGVTILPSLSMTDVQGLPLLIALALSLVGVLVAWRWELTGGIMTIFGAAAVISMVCLGSGTDMFLCSLLFTAPLLVAGGLSLACCYRTRARIVA